MIHSLGEPCVALLPQLEQLRVDERALQRLAQQLREDPPGLPAWEVPSLPREPGPGLDAVVVLGNALNFCYWVPDARSMWTLRVAGRDQVDALAMFGALHLAWQQGADLCDGRWLAGEGPVDILAQGHGWLPLRAERIAILRGIGRELQRSYGGRLEPALAAAGEHAVGLARFLAASFPSFEDSRLYRNSSLRFLKRAQLAAAMLHCRRRALGLPGLRGCERLVIFADYMLPRLLRARGVLRYGPQLASAVDSGAELPAGARAETEIRVATVGVGERLRAMVPGLEAIALDHRLWRLGQRLEGRHHRTLTTDY